MPPLPKTAEISPKVLELCSKLSPGTSPIFLEVEPCDFAKENECFPNVEEMIKKKGGSIQYGWQLWETLPGLMIEGEFHAVWADTEGIYHEITPKEFGIKRILFLPDNSTKYEGKQIDNVRVAITNEPAVFEYIKSSEEMFREISKSSSDDDLFYVQTQELEKIQKNNITLLFAIIKKFFPSTKERSGTSMVFSGKDRNKPCHCGSGKKYKKCCIGKN